MATIPDYLLQKNQISSKDNIDLFQASLRGDIDEVRRLLKTGAKPDFFFRPEDQRNALHVSAENGHVHVVQELLTYGAVVNAISGADQATALILASHSTSPQIVSILETLVKAGSNIHASNGYGNTALHEAVHCGNANSIAYLLREGADPNTPNNKGSTALHIFCYGDSPKVHSVALFQNLLSSGANPSAKDSRGMTAALVCCTSGRIDLLEILVKNFNETLLDEVDHSGRSAESIASYYKHDRVVRYLQENAKLQISKVFIVGENQSKGMTKDRYLSPIG